MEARLTPANRPRATNPSRRPSPRLRSWAMLSAGTCAAASCRSTSISPRIPRWCSARTLSGAVFTVPGSPTPAGLYLALHPSRPCSRRRWTGFPPTSSPRQPSPCSRTTRTIPRCWPARQPTAPRSRKARSSSARGGRLSQIVNGRPVVVPIRQGKSEEGITIRAAKVIRALLPIRDAIRDVLRAQAADCPWAQAQVRLRVAYSAFIRYFGPINHTVVTTVTDQETGEERETHRRPNLSHFADDPDCWLVASIESYDVETDLARKGPIFSERVIAPPVAPLITSAADALAVTLNETGRVDLDHLADLVERDPETALAQLGTTVFRNPRTEAW